MASVRSTIDLVITGATRGLAAASAEADAMARRVADAEDRVSAARTRSAAAEDRVGVAERRLQDARQGQEAALSRIGVAETNLERVRENSNGATTRLARAQADLDAVRQNSASTAEDIERAENRVNQVRTESDRAAQALQRAEAQLATARANSDRAGGRITAAEAALARARSDAVRASEGAARAENDLNNLRRRGNQDVDQQRSGILGLFDAFSRLGNALTGADDASNRFLSTAGALNNLIGSIGGPIGQLVIGIVELVAGFSALLEIVGVVGGLIGQVLGGAIPVLVTLAAAAGGVLLGMDGIKKAAEAMTPAFDKLKASVSATFQKELTPAFRELATVIPQLTDGFNNIADAVSGVITQVIGLVKSSEGIQNLQFILLGAADLVRGLGQGIQDFLQGILAATAAAQPAMEGLGQAIGSVLSNIGDVLFRLAGNGIIQKAVEGLSATLKGLGDVIAPVIEILIRMGAALGATVGSALTNLGKIIESTTPFFEHLAFVAGDLLKSAFEQLGPPIERLFGGTIPDANAAMDAFAGFIKDTVLPAIASFIDWIRTDGIPGFKAFADGIIINITEAGSAILGFVSGSLGALEELMKAAFFATGDQKFLTFASAIEVAKRQVDGLKTNVDALHDKTVKVLAQGADTSTTAVNGLTTAIHGVPNVTVETHSLVFGNKENEALTNTIRAVPNVTVATHSLVYGTPENKNLTAAIDSVHDTTKKSLSNVFGTNENNQLTAAIDRVHDKTVNVKALVSGRDGIDAMRAAIDSLHDKTVTVGVNFSGSASSIAHASGGPVVPGKTFIVGERGPEILTMGSKGSGFITNTARSQAILQGGGGDAPITVQVNLSQNAIAGIAEVVIQRRDRSTKRIVNAGSGATF